MSVTCGFLCGRVAKLYIVSINNIYSNFVTLFLSAVMMCIEAHIGAKFKDPGCLLTCMNIIKFCQHQSARQAKLNVGKRLHVTGFAKTTFQN